MADYSIASDLSLQVLEKRQRDGELRAPELDERNRLFVAPVLLPCAPQVVTRKDEQKRGGGA